MHGQPCRTHAPAPSLPRHMPATQPAQPRDPTARCQHLTWEEVSHKAQEERHIVVHKLWQVGVPQGTHEDQGL